MKELTWTEKILRTSRIFTFAKRGVLEALAWFERFLAPTKVSLSAKGDDVANGTRAWIRASSPHSTTATLLILAGYRTRVKFEPSI